MLKRRETDMNMEELVVTSPIHGTWLVGEPQPRIGKSVASGVAVWFYYGSEAFKCEEHGSFINSTRGECHHIEAVKSFEMRKAPDWMPEVTW